MKGCLKMDGLLEEQRMVVLMWEELLGFRVLLSLSWMKGCLKMDELLEEQWMVVLMWEEVLGFRVLHHMGRSLEHKKVGKKIIWKQVQSLLWTFLVYEEAYWSTLKYQMIHEDKRLGRKRV
jgi:hypothetical protein